MGNVLVFVKLINVRMLNQKIRRVNLKKKNFKTLWPLFMDGVQLSQG